MARVTVGMPIYNGEAFLREALDCFEQQEFDDFEFVVSDNASTDATPDILDEYARHDRRIRVLRRPETVASCENFNGLVPEATAPYFTWASCDDLREPSFLAELVAALDDSPACVLSYSHTDYVGDQRRAGRLNSRQKFSPGSEDSILGRLISIVRGRQYQMVHGLIRTDMLRKTRLFVGPMGLPSDIGLCLELATLGSMCCVQKELMALRLHDKSLTITHDDDLYLRNRGELDDAALEFVESFPLSSTERRLFMRELKSWSRKHDRAHRRMFWKIGAFRSAYVHSSRVLIDLERAVLRV